MKVFFDDRQQLHDPQTYLSRGQMRKPQEVPARSLALLDGVRSLGLEVLQPGDHGREPLARVHDAGYLEFLETGYRRWHEVGEDWGDEILSNVFVRYEKPPRGILGEAAYYLADGSCPVGEHTWTAAYWAAQGALSAADALQAGDRVAFAVCRPPGHHARRAAAGGFCYLNNAAIAAEALTARFPRVAILDPDMHHGQGIQEIFYDRDDVLYVSIHGDTTNFYPAVTGFEDERGSGAGVGYNLNLPMPHGSSEEVFFDRLADAVSAIEAFRPDALVVALGFDTHEKDPQAKVAVSSEGFHRLGRTIAGLGVPMIVVQEGGYYLEGLAENVRQFFTGVGAA